MPLSDAYRKSKLASRASHFENEKSFSLKSYHCYACYVMEFPLQMYWDSQPVLTNGKNPKLKHKANECGGDIQMCASMGKQKILSLVNFSSNLEILTAFSKSLKVSFIVHLFGLEVSHAWPRSWILPFATPVYI